MITDRTIFKYTFEVFDGYQAISRCWKRKKNRINHETLFASPDKARLRTQAYMPTRQVKIFLNSYFRSGENIYHFENDIERGNGDRTAR